MTMLERPVTQIDAASAQGTAPAQDELMARTAELVAPFGPWPRMWDATQRLEAQVCHALITNEFRAYNHAAMDATIRKLPMPEEPAALKKYATRPWEPDMTERAMEGRLVGHYGLRAECMNGPGMSILYRLQQKALGTVSIENIAAIIDRFDDLSQMSKAIAIPDDAVSHLKYPKQTSREAYGRLADDIDHWINANHDIIPASEQAAIRYDLADYRQALADVLKYVDFAKENLAQRGLSSKPAVAPIR